MVDESAYGTTVERLATEIMEVDNIEFRLCDEGYIEDVPESIQDMADEVLIDSTGPNYKTVTLLEKHGIRIVAGETDSYGWLTGVIITPKGKRLVFG